MKKLEQIEFAECLLSLIQNLLRVRPLSEDAKTKICRWSRTAMLSFVLAEFGLSLFYIRVQR